MIKIMFEKGQEGRDEKNTISVIVGEYPDCGNISRNMHCIRYLGASGSSSSQSLFTWTLYSLPTSGPSATDGAYAFRWPS